MNQKSDLKTTKIPSEFCVLKIATRFLRIPDHIRRELKKPFGKLYKTTSEVKEKLLEIEPVLIISVGDDTTKNLLENCIKVDIIAYDGRVRRNYVGIYDVINKFEADLIRIKNPAGFISREAFEKIQNILSETRDEKRPVKIYVDGEEDLLTIPLVLFAPDNTVVLYGQPNEGVVMIKVDENIKKNLKNIIDRIKSQQGV